LKWVSQRDFGLCITATAQALVEIVEGDGDLEAALVDDAIGTHWKRLIEWTMRQRFGRAVV